MPLVVAGLCLLAALGSGGFAIASNERADAAEERAEDASRTAQAAIEQAANSRVALAEQIATNRKSICGQANQTALAYRARSIDPTTGEIESIEHFEDRLEAQAFTLQASRGQHCESNAGLPDFAARRHMAIEEITRLLGHRPQVGGDGSSTGTTPGSPSGPAEGPAETSPDSDDGTPPPSDDETPPGEPPPGDGVPPPPSGEPPGGEPSPSIEDVLDAQIESTCERLGADCSAVTHPPLLP